MALNETGFLTPNVYQGADVSFDLSLMLCPGGYDKFMMSLYLPSSDPFEMIAVAHTIHTQEKSGH